MRKYQVTVYVPEAIYQTAVRFLLLYRKLRYGYPFRRIKLTRGLYAKVDPEDYPRLSKYKWYATSDKNNKVYAERTAWCRGKKKRNILMHREVLFGANPKSEILTRQVGIRQIQNSNDKNSKEKNKLLVDHINGNGLDNRKANLRVCTAAQNNCNRRPQRNCISRYKGMTRTRRGKPWRAVITINRRTKSLGSFESEIEAAKAYDKAAKKYHGEYASLNFAGRKERKSRRAGNQ